MVCFMRAHTSYHSQDLQYAYAAAIGELGTLNQHLLKKCRNYGLLDDARKLKTYDEELTWLWRQVKQSGQLSNEEQQEAGYTHYIWHTQRDDRVRGTHAINSGKMFAWNAPPPTGHPGEDYNCRCWAEPIGSDEYARQTLITPIHDNPDKWTNADLNNHYVNGSGRTVALSEIGYLGDVITLSNRYIRYTVTSLWPSKTDRTPCERLFKPRFSGPLAVQRAAGYSTGRSECLGRVFSRWHSGKCNLVCQTMHGAQIQVVSGDNCVREVGVIFWRERWAVGPYRSTPR